MDRKAKQVTKQGNSTSRSVAKKVAASKMYTARGEPIRNVDAYMAAGGRPLNSAGEVIRNPRAYQNAIEASVRQNTNDPKYLYHYTPPDAAASIEKSGVIQQSSNGCAGSGTYLTAKPPRCKAETLLSNNYGSAGRAASYVDRYIRLDADNLNAERVTSDRDVWKVNGNVNYKEHNGYVAERRPPPPPPQKKTNAEFSSYHYHHSTVGANQDQLDCCQGEEPYDQYDHDDCYGDDVGAQDHCDYHGEAYDQYYDQDDYYGNGDENHHGYDGETDDLILYHDDYCGGAGDDCYYG